MGIGEVEKVAEERRLSPGRGSAGFGLLYQGGKAVAGGCLGVHAWGLKNKKPVMIAQTPGLEVVKGTERSCTQMWGSLGKRRGRNEEEEVCRKGQGTGCHTGC